ncbi:MAG: glucodextranase DOMON-like domain-containing protein [Acidimicrobiia bacterium]
MRRASLFLIALALLGGACTPDSEGGSSTTTAPASTSTTSVSSGPEDGALDASDLFVNLVWHQHQPLYPKDTNGVVTRPWVRVHATKDYLDMAAMVRDYPGLNITFNLTPVLLLQLEDIVNGAKDVYWTHTEIPADELTDAEKTFIMARFWDINPKIIDRFPRYKELRDLRDEGTAFAVEDWRDLQLLWNLGWTDPRFISELPKLSKLEAKGRDFTEQDKATVLGIHLAIVSDVVQIHTELWDEGIIEVTTTPLAHPILPLIGDTNQALVGDPAAIMPSDRFREMNDAVDHVVFGLDEAERMLGRRPSGMWPGEGSVSQLVTPIWAGQGVTWVATGEHVLGETLGIGSLSRDSTGTVEDADVLYRPYVAQHSRQPELPMFFRDVQLADLIGFEYSGTPADQAAKDFMNRLDKIDDRLDKQGYDGLRVVTIVVDGENAWENYDNDGIDFLDALYTRLTTTEGIMTATPSRLLAEFPDQFEALPEIFPASWFQPNFRTWIGEAEEAMAWEYLFDVRSDLRQAADTVDDTAYQAAYESMLFAEGSDWFWWYGSDQESGDDSYFDGAYRELLGQVYDALGLERPGFIRVPIIPHPAVEPDRTPTDIVTVDVGAFDDDVWQQGGLFEGEYPLQWAFDAENLYLRLDNLDGHQTEIYLGVPGATPSRGLSLGVPEEESQQVLGFQASHVIRVYPDGSARMPASVSSKDPSDVDAYFADAPALEAEGSGTSAEIAVPIEALGAIQIGDRVSILSIVDEPGSGSTAPELGRGEMQVPDISNVEILFQSEDPTGDDNGPGTYTYPTDQVFGPGSYDLTRFTVGQSGEELVFEFEVNAPIVNSWDSPTGLSIQSFDVYVDVDPGASNGARTLIDGRNASLSAGNGWERALAVEGWPTFTALFEADASGTANETQPSMTILVFGDQGRVVVRIDRSLFPDGDPATWGYAVALMSQEGFPSAGVRRVRDVLPTAQQWKIGGGDASINATRILDLLWPDDGAQQQMLTPAEAVASGNLDDLTPDDFGQIDVLIAP